MIILGRTHSGLNRRDRYRVGITGTLSDAMRDWIEQSQSLRRVQRLRQDEGDFGRCRLGSNHAGSLREEHVRRFMWS